jgi:hypothetical protein
MTERFGQKLDRRSIMLTRVAFGMAIVLATVSGSLAATRTHAVSFNQTVYNPAGAYVGTDPDQGIRFELSRDADRAHAN